MYSTILHTHLTHYPDISGVGVCVCVERGNLSEIIVIANACSESLNSFKVSFHYGQDESNPSHKECAEVRPPHRWAKEIQKWATKQQDKQI